MAGDIFDPNTAKVRLQKSYERMQRGRTGLESAIGVAQESVTETNETYAKNLNRISKQSNELTNDALSALDRLDAIDSNPAIVNKVMGLFDDDYNQDIQTRRLQRVQFETQRLNQNAQIADDLRQINLQKAQQGLSIAEKLYQFDRSGFVDQSEALSLGFQIEANIDKKTLDLAKNASFENLTAWRNDPSKAPVALRGKPGLIESVWVERELQKRGVTQAVQLEEMRGFEIQQTQERLAIAEMDPAQVHSFAALIKKGKSPKLPKGISPQAIVDESNRQNQVEIGIASAQQAMQLGNIELRNKSVSNALSQMTTPEIGQLLEAAQAGDGTVKTGNLVLTEQELLNARAEGIQRDAANKQAIDNVLLAGAGTSGLATEAFTGIDTLASLYDDGSIDVEDPTELLPPRIQAEIGTLEDQFAAARAIGSATGQVAALEKLNTVVKDHTEKFITQKPKNEQDAYRQFVQDGRVKTNEAAAGYMEFNLPNSFALMQDDINGPIWQAFSEQYLELTGQDTTSFSTGGPGTGGEFAIVKTDAPDAQNALEDAAKKTRDYAGGVLFQAHAASTIERMYKEMEANVARAGQGLPQQTNIWDGVVNFNSGRFEADVYETDAEGNQVFDVGRFSQMLAVRTQILKDKGVLKPGESLNELLVNEMGRSHNSWIAQTTSGSVEKAALYKSLFGNNQATALRQNIAKFNTFTNTTLAVTQERSREMQVQLRNITHAFGVESAANAPMPSNPAAPIGAEMQQFTTPQAPAVQSPGDELLLEYLRGNNQ